MKTQIPIIATRCINICPTRLKHDHYDGPALSLHARAPPRRAARAPCRSRGDSLAIPGPARPGRVRTRAGSRARDELLSSRLRPGPRVAVEIQSRVDCETGPGRTDGDRAAQDWPDPVRADIPDNNVMVSSLTLSTSRNNVIISPDPTQAIHSHITLTHSELCKVRRLEYLVLDGQCSARNN